MAGMNGLVLVTDLFSVYLFLEVAAIASYSLVVYGLEHDELEASFKYLMLSVIASAGILLSLAIIFGMTGNLGFAAGPHGPGAVFVVEKDRIADEGFSTHKLSLVLFVRYLEESIGCKVMVLGIQPETIDFNVRANELSDPVKKSVNTLSEFLSKTLAKKYRIRNQAKGRQEASFFPRAISSWA